MKPLAVIYLGLIGVFAVTLIWAAFDIHSRISFVMFAQAPVLVLRMFVKRKWREESKRPNA